MADIPLTVTIPSAKVAIATARFLRETPIPLIDDPESTEETPLPRIPKYTTKRWVEMWIIRRLSSQCEQGRIKLEHDANVPDTDLFV